MSHSSRVARQSRPLGSTVNVMRSWGAGHHRQGEHDVQEHETEREKEGLSAQASTVKSTVLQLAVLIRGNTNTSASQVSVRTRDQDRVSGEGVGARGRHKQDDWMALDDAPSAGRTAAG